ncbi:MAG TPA: S8 family peptidase [Paucimonas sp.]|nr:S8 family peptidase [Paucimonas sp.]
MKQSCSKFPAFARLCTAALIASASGLAAAAVPDSGMAATAAAHANFTDRVIVKYKDPLPMSKGAKTAAPMRPLSAERLTALQQVGRQHGLTMRALRVIGTGAHVVKLDKRLSLEQARAVTKQIQSQDPNIEYAEPDRLLQPTFTPNDPFYALQWHYYESVGGIRAPAAWDKSIGTGVTVAVLDTGYRPHADLATHILPGYDFISDPFVANDGDARDADARDPGDWVLAGECGGGQPTRDFNSSWHGTHVSGTISALTNNGSGVAGVASGARVVPARVLGKCGGYLSDVADAVTWAYGGNFPDSPPNPYPARVINMSLGGFGPCDLTMLSVIISANQVGASVVVSAGNANMDVANFTPANCPGVISVAATDRTGGKAWYSNFGPLVDLAAPGGDTRFPGGGVLSTFNAGLTTPGADAYAFYQGTSMAAPHAAATAALMLAKNPTLTAAEVETRLKATARAFPAACAGCGNGIIDAAAATKAAVDPGPTIHETEPNDDLATAIRILNCSTMVKGTMGTTSDSDYYRLELPPGATLTAKMAPTGAADYDLYVRDGNGDVIFGSLLGPGALETLSVTNSGSAPATYYVEVAYGFGGTGPVNGRYSLKIDW